MFQKIKNKLHHDHEDSNNLATAAPEAPEAAPAKAAAEAIQQQRAQPGAETAAAAAAAMMATNGVAASSEWLTSLIEKMWPYASKAVEKQVLEMVPGIIEANKPKWMEGIVINKFQLGPQPPKITFINVDQENDDEVDDIRMEVGLEWRSDTDIELTVKPMPADIKGLGGIIEKTVQKLVSVHAGVEDLTIKATVIVTMVPMVPVIPVLRSVQVCMREQPQVDFKITFSSAQSGVLNMLKPFILKVLKTAVFASMVYPEHITVKLDPSAPDYFTPEGLLLVTVREAKNLPNNDWFSKGDPFVNVSVRDKWKKKTATKSGNDPKFNETFELMVHSRRLQRLSLELMDEDSGTSADSIGVASCALSELEPGQTKEVWLDVYEHDAAKEPIKDCKVLVAMTYLISRMPEIQALKTNPTNPLPPGVATLLQGGIVKVSFKSVTRPNKEAGPLLAEVKGAGESRWTGSIAAPAATPDMLTIPTTQAFDFDILAKDVNTAFEIALAHKKGGDPVARFTFTLADIKTKNPQVGIVGGTFEFRSNNGYGLATDAYYHDL
jgi:hypothetical protein